MSDLLILAAAAFAAGLLNAVAGGGTFITFPALAFLGVPVISANATASFSALPGYVGSAWAFRRDIRAEGSLALRWVSAVAVLGSIAGAALLIVKPGRVFAGIVPFLLALATLLFALGPKLMLMVQRRGLGNAGPALSAAAIFAVSLYGGYFNGGLGIMLLATFGLLGFTNLHGMNGLKNVLSAIVTAVSVATFVAAGLIAWEYALVMAAACALGGFAGGWATRRITRTDLLRHFITAVGAAMTVAFFLV